MTWFAAPLVLALAVTSTQTPLPRMTHAEGLLTADTYGVRTAGGRAELVLADGAIVHLDAGTTVRYAEALAFLLDDGRVVVRAGDQSLEIETPLAALRLQPGAICTLLVDASAGRLLVNVAVGELTLRTRYAHTTRVVAGHSALMTGATSVPWPAAYTHTQLDHFAIWSDARMAASGQTAYGASDWAASGLSGASFGSSPPCSGWPSWSAPCWVLPPAYQKPWRSRPLPPASYAPNYAPNYTPNFNVSPGPGTGPGGGGAPPHHPPQTQPRPQPLPQPPQPPPNPPPSQARPAAREWPGTPGAAVPRPPSP
jgi:hypothetical protein